MDREAELVKTENWSELKRYYSARSGHAWELGWVHLLKIRDHSKAIECFQKTLQDPRYEEASFIMLAKLGRKPGFRRSVGPINLRLYEAFQAGDFGPLQKFIESSSENRPYADAIVRACCEVLSLDVVNSLKNMPLAYSTYFLLGQHSEKVLRNAAVAEYFYRKFLLDPWVIRIIEESKRLLIDADLSKRIRHAYAQKDGITVSRLLRSISFRLDKVEGQMLSPVWSEAFADAVEFESQHITQDLFGFQFWNAYDWSPRALERIRSRLFLEDPIENPPFVTEWKKFFESDDLLVPPVELDPESLALWQIKVEVDPLSLSDALLKFPTEERFLFLWSLRQRESRAAAEAEERLWPQDEKESDVVRKNLERAFDRATNKILWFDRLRQVGCSQNFYEYALERTEVPMEWVLGDLSAGLIKATQTVRAFLKNQLSVVVTSNSNHLAGALAYLTPAETQEVLLARFVLSPLPEDFLNEDYLDLLWEAQARVSAETAQRWQNEVLQFIAKKRNRKSLQTRHWRWVQLCWDRDAVVLEQFAPQVEEGENFPWEDYLEKLSFHQNESLLLMCLHRIPNERMREAWIESSMAKGRSDSRILSAITTLSEDYVRHSLLARWYELKGDIEKSIQHRQEELTHTPIMNEQLKIGRKILDLLRIADSVSPARRLTAISELSKFLEANGGLDGELCFEISILFERDKQFTHAWKFAIQQWVRASTPLREELLPRLIDLSYRSKNIEETQRFLIDQVFQENAPSRLAFEMIEALLNDRSPLRIRHLRPEFIEKASRLYPLHQALLKARAQFDYRAVLLWQSFFGEPIKNSSSVPAFDSKRIYELWGLTDSGSNADSYSIFSKYLDHLPAEIKEKDKHEFKDKADRILTRVAKQFGIKKYPRFELVRDLSTPFRIHFQPGTLLVQTDFFNLLDEETWTAFSVGLLQIFDDREKGLYEERRLIERFFQAMLLSAAPVQKIIRFIVWLGIHEGLAKPSVLQTDPQVLIETLPFLNSFIIFYLGCDFEEKMKICAIIPS